ncbi:hypothetical protein [Arthrobacter sp. PAMC 25486]|uniref:hypothetical protein n=1 Tax=Arthrobacter sp. PAMC 25486 TaxID=1494608 RepID=UPI000A9182F6|nr:hypothetical protein [Arthrobacter sp. PAMC 25486]
MKMPAKAAAVSLLALSLALTGCDVTLTRVESSPSVTPPATTEQSPAPTASQPPSNISKDSNTEKPTEAPAEKPGPVAEKWKNFTDAGKTISFELPDDWTVKVLPPPKTGAVQLEVRNNEGHVMATLGTQISGLGGACQPESQSPYIVLASIPMELPSDNESREAVEPRFVYRVIQGATHYFASYGITDHSAGLDGKACLVYNTVTSQQLGIYMFGDVLQFSSDPMGSPGLRAFPTIADAQTYMLSSEYQNIQKMLTSLTATR